jgi:hypothetical protein
MIRYFNNFVSPYYQKDLQNEIFDKSFTWNYHDVTSGGKSSNYSWIDDENTEESPQLVHVLTDKSSIFPLVTPMIYKISETVDYQVYIDRIKINLMWPLYNKKNLNSYNRPHVDHQKLEAKTLIYYVNDSDGDTIIFDKRYTGSDPGKLTVVERVTPKSGSAILFDSNMFHSSSNPTQGKRSVINFIFWKQSEHKEFEFPPIEQTLRNV